MRRLTIIVAVLATLYSAYWVFGSRAVENAAQTQVTLLREDGWAVDYDSLKVQGFPSRFDTSLTELALTSPDGAITYAVPMVQALALSYRPNDVILAFPDQQDVTVDGIPFTATSPDLRARLTLQDTTALALETLTAQATTVVIADTAGPVLTFRDMLTAVRAAGPLPNTYDLYANVADLSFAPAVMDLLRDNSALPASIAIVNADATVTLDRAINRHTLPKWQDEPGRLRSLTIKTLEMTWGDLTISGDGALQVDAEGLAEGTVTFTANDWRRMLDMAQMAGLIAPEFQFLARSIGETMSGGATDLILPITFQTGNLSVGPIPLGPAPRFF